MLRSDDASLRLSASSSLMMAQARRSLPTQSPRLQLEVQTGCSNRSTQSTAQVRLHAGLRAAPPGQLNSRWRQQRKWELSDIASSLVWGQSQLLHTHG